MKKSIFFYIALLFLISACAAAAATPAYMADQGVLGRSISEEAFAPATPAATYAPSAKAGSGSSESESLSTAGDRIVIMNASRTLVVNDPAEAAKQIATMAAAKGGWVVNSNIAQSSYGQNGEKYYSGNITIRVPAEKLDGTLVEIEALAVEVKSRQLTGQDVTADYVDMESQLKNLRASQDRLIEISKTADPETLVAINSQLQGVQGEMNVIEGRLRYYNESAKYSSISVALQPYIPSQPIDIGGWHPEGTAKEAVEALVHGLQWLVDTLIFLGICGIPALLVLALIVTPFVLITRFLIRRSRKTK